MGLIQAAVLSARGVGHVRSSESELPRHADVSRGPILPGKMEQWSNMDRDCSVVTRGQPDRLWCRGRHNGECTRTYVPALHLGAFADENLPFVHRYAAACGDKVHGVKCMSVQSKIPLCLYD